MLFVVLFLFQPNFQYDKILCHDCLRDALTTARQSRITIGEALCTTVNKFGH